MVWTIASARSSKSRHQRDLGQAREFALDAFLNLKARADVDAMDTFAIVGKTLAAKQYGETRKPVTVVIDRERNQA